MDLMVKALDVKQQLRMETMACMETGNTPRARTLVRELREVDKDAGTALLMDVVQTYGTVL